MLTSGFLKGGLNFHCFLKAFKNAPFPLTPPCSEGCHRAGLTGVPNEVAQKSSAWADLIPCDLVLFCSSELPRFSLLCAPAEARTVLVHKAKAVRLLFFKS